MADGGEAVRLPNPFEGAQREGKERTVKYCLFEVLARHYRDGARVAELEKDERLLALRPKMRAAKNLNGQITGELGSDKGVHFIRDFKGQPGVWGVRLHAAAAAGEQTLGGSAGSAAASAQQQGADAAAPAPHGAQQQQQQQQQDAQPQHQHPGAQPKLAARGPKSAAIPSPPVPGNESEAAPWAGATCQFLTDRLWKKGAAVWWPAEQQYFNGKIVETLSEEGGDLLLLHVLYDDQTDEWMRPTRFKVSGGKEHSVVVITENEVYIRDEASGRLVPDPNQGVDPAALGSGQAAGGGDAAAQQQRALQQPQSVRSAASRSSGGHGGRRPHAARAPADIPTKGSWWQKAVVDDEARALELQKQQLQKQRTTSSDEPHPQSPTAADGRAQQAQQAQQAQRQQQAEQQPATQQTQRPEGQQQERKRKLPTEEAGAERAQAQQGKLPVQLAQKGRQQRPHEQQHAEKRQRRESSAADEHPQQQRRQSQGGERPARPPIPPSSAPVAPKFFSIPKRPQAEQPAPKQGAVGAAEGSKAKGAGGSTPFRIPKAATAPSAAAPTAAGAASAERQGGKRSRESVEGASDQRRHPQSQGRVETERGQREQHAPPPPPPSQQQQHGPQQQHGHERMQQQQPAASSPHDQQRAQQQHAPHPLQPSQQQHPRERHEQQQQQQERQRQEHGRERDQQRQPRARSPEAVRKEERATRDLILRHCKADVHQRMGAVRWAVPAASAQLPTPRLEPGSAAAVDALVAPHKAALSERLSVGGPWPHGAALLPAPDAAAAGLPGATAAAPAQPTEDAQFGRIFVCKRNTTSACFKRNVFVSNSDIDLQGLQPDSLALLHSLDEKLVYGWFKVLECGTNLDPGFPADAAFKYHVRVQPLHLFQPVPDTLLDTFVERKVHPKTGQRMKFFDRHLDGRQCRQIWSLMHHYNEKLHDSRDTLWRLSPLTPAGAGFWKALAQQEARAASGGGGGGEQQDVA